MRKRLLFCAGAVITLVMTGGRQQQLVEADALKALLRPQPESEMCLMPPEGSAFRQTRGGGAGGRLTDKVVTQEQVRLAAG